MDPDPLPRTLLVSGVTFVTVGLVTLSLGTVFVVASSTVWVSAVVSGACSAVWGSALVWLSFGGRFRRPATLCCLTAFVVACSLLVAAIVTLVVISAFHAVKKEEEWREMWVFFIASSGIQLFTLVVVSLVLHRIVDPSPLRSLFKREAPLTGGVQDNYGFVPDGPMWCGNNNNGRVPGSPLSRWTGVDKLDGSPSSYMASEHHPKFIKPSSDDNSSSSGSTVSEPPRTGGVSAATPNGNVATANGRLPPKRPPRSCDRRKKPPVPTPRSTTPSIRPPSVTRRLFIYDPVELQIPSRKHQLELRSMLASMPRPPLDTLRPAAAFYKPWTSDRFVWEENGLPAVPPAEWPPAKGPFYFGDNAYRYDHAIPRTRGAAQRYPSSSSVFTVHGWRRGQERFRQSPPPPHHPAAKLSTPRKVTFLEADV